MKRLKLFFSKEMSFFLSVPAILWQVLFLVIPLLVIAYYSISFDGYGITISHYINLISWVYVRIIGRSLFLATCATIMCLFCAYPVAYFLALYVRHYKNFLLFLLTLPFWTSSLVQIYAWFYLLENHGLINRFLLFLGIINEPLMLTNNLIGIFIVMCYCYLPFMIMPLYSTLSKLDVRFLEASADLGATPWQTFKHITLPLSLPGIKTGLLLVLVPAFGEFAIPSLLGGGKHMFVGSLISYYFLVARDNSLGAAFTMLSGAVLLITALTIHYLCRTRISKKGLT